MNEKLLSTKKMSKRICNKFINTFKIMKDWINDQKISISKSMIFTIKF